MKIQKKSYYCISFRLSSPLAVGSGQNEETDKDLMRNGNNVPYLPASAIAGVARTLFDIEECRKYFGEVMDSSRAKQAQEKRQKTSASSRILFYDANIDKADLDKYRVSRRDSVALDEWKTAKEGAKFDMEVLEPGIRFVTYMEQNLYEGDEAVAEKIAAAWKAGVFRFGGKTMRGYGEITDVSVKKVMFCLSEKTDKNVETDELDVAKWLEFNMYNDAMWDKQTEWTESKLYQSNECCIELSLKLKGAISIRRYTTGIDVGNEPDFEQLTVSGVNGKIPVIPGTTWCGAFRSQIRKLIPGIDESYFGIVSNTEKSKSKIRFGESKLIGAKEKILMHNAIDRFDGGTIDTALFKERTYYGGTTKLTISFQTDISDQLLEALAASIVDLNYGFLSVGGMTGVGRGIFEVELVNETKLETDEKLEVQAAKQYKQITAILMNLKGECHG